MIWRPGKTGLRTHEGGKAHREAVEFLKGQSPLPAFGWDDGLAKAALDHARDIGAAGITGHTGSDGSKMGQRIERHTQWSGSIGENIDFGIKDSALHVVKALIVDDGVSTRGHRANCFSELFKLCGVAVSQHSKKGSCAVFDFAVSTGGAGGGSGVKEIDGKMAAIDLGEKGEKYDMNDDPDMPANCTGVKISVSTKTEGNKTIKTTTKTYTLKGGATQTVTQTQTTIRS